MILTSNSQEVYLGTHSFNKLPECLEALQARSVFVVAGPVVWDLHQKTILQLLEAYQLRHFHNFGQNPKEQDIYRGTAAFLQQPSDVILAIGGGSTIDLAKMICVQAARPEPLSSLPGITEKGAIQRKSARLIAVPTTAGTGSEATQFAVFYIAGKKYSADNPIIRPDIAIIDPFLSYSMPPYLAASTAADALAQAVESYWNIHSTEESQSYAQKALQLIWPAMEAAVEGQQQARAQVVEAAHYAGKAINITRTTAPHAFSYYFTSEHKVPHGHAVALSLARILKYNYRVTSADCTDKRGYQFVQRQLEQLAQLLSCASVSELATNLEQKFQNAGLHLDAQRYLSNPQAKEEFVQSINFARLANNPRKIEVNDLQLIFDITF